MALVLDTGPVLAALDADDADHAACAGLVRDCREPLVIVSTTLVEIDYWIRKRLDAAVWLAFVEDIAAGAYRLEHAGADDLIRAAELERAYAKWNLGLVDASVIAVCERLGERRGRYARSSSLRGRATSTLRTVADRSRVERGL